MRTTHTTERITCDRCCKQEEGSFDRNHEKGWGLVSWGDGHQADLCPGCYIGFQAYMSRGDDK